MPNWSTNDISIKGKKKDILAFLNTGLKNCGFNSKRKVETAFDELVKNGFALSGNTTCGKDEKGMLKKETIKNVTLGTFRPMPESYLTYDTTNYPDLFPDVVKEQKKLGAVGWYDYNNNVRLGTKWDSDMEGLSLSYNEETENYTLSFSCDTAWSYPDLWLYWVKNTFPNLRVFIAATEESNAYLFYGEVLEGNDIDYNDYLATIDELDWDDEEVYEKLEDAYDNMYSDYDAEVSKAVA